MWVNKEDPLAEWSVSKSLFIYVNLRMDSRGIKKNLIHQAAWFGTQCLKAEGTVEQMMNGALQKLGSGVCGHKIHKGTNGLHLYPIL